VEKADADLSLENERLDEYLESANPAPPVVVVQYRNRGVPSWVFFPLIMFVPVGAIWGYHRLVVERYRAQAIESRRLLESRIEAPQFGGSLAGDARPFPLAVSAQPAVPVPGQSGPSESVPDPATATAAPSAAQTAAVSAPPTLTTAVSTAAPPAHPSTDSAAGQKDSSERGFTDPSQALSQPRNPAHADPEPNPSVVAAIAQPPAPGASSPTGAGAKAEPRFRSILPNPFAPDDPPAGPASEVPGDRAGPAAVRDDQATRPLRDRGPANRDAQVALPAPEPLPSKEETLRQIEEEAARKQAEILARDENREQETRTRRHEERVKFREELREVLLTHGNVAGPEIDKLAKRYGFDVDSQKHEQAVRIWQFKRGSLLSKVRLIRSLDLPESVILDFLSDDLNVRRNTPKGPRNKNEVRVRAANQLLSFELAEAGSAVPPAAAADRRASPARTQPLTPPAGGAGPRP